MEHFIPSLVWKIFCVRIELTGTVYRATDTSPPALLPKYPVKWTAGRMAFQIPFSTTEMVKVCFCWPTTTNVCCHQIRLMLQDTSWGKKTCHWPTSWPLPHRILKEFWISKYLPDTRAVIKRSCKIQILKIKESGGTSMPLSFRDTCMVIYRCTIVVQTNPFTKIETDACMGDASAIWCFCCILVKYMQPCWI